MRWRRFSRKAAAVLLPWPPRHARRAAISGARREKERSRASAGRARDVERQIRRMAEQNHFATTIAEQIMRGTR